MLDVDNEVISQEYNPIFHDWKLKKGLASFNKTDIEKLING